MIKTNIKTEILDIRVPDMKSLGDFGSFKKVRDFYKLDMNDMEECVCCDKKFEKEDEIHLAIIKGSTNRLTCDKCFLENKQDVSTIYK